MFKGPSTVSFASSVPVPFPTLALKVVPAVVEIVNSLVLSIGAVEAKVMVPVRPQYEKAVMWYLETGEICTEGNLTAETDDDRYLSLLKELNNSDEAVVIDKWQTRVPSTLTIIQSKSTYLDDSQGLPTDNYDNVEIGSNDAVMVGLENASTTEEE